MSIQNQVYYQLIAESSEAYHNFTLASEYFQWELSLEWFVYYQTITAHADAVGAMTSDEFAGWMFELTRYSLQTGYVPEWIYQDVTTVDALVESGEPEPVQMSLF